MHDSKETMNNPTGKIIEIPVGSGWTISLYRQQPDGRYVGARSSAPADEVPDAIDSLVLAHAAAGVDVLDERYIEGLNTALEAHGNHCDEDDWDDDVPEEGRFDE